MRCVRVAQSVDRCCGVDAGALGSLLDNEIDGSLGLRTAGPPDGLEHRRGRRRIVAAGKEAGGDHRGDQHLPTLTALADDSSPNTHSHFERPCLGLRHDPRAGGDYPKAALCARPRYGSASNGTSRAAVWTSSLKPACALSLISCAEGQAAIKCISEVNLSQDRLPYGEFPPKPPWRLQQDRSSELHY
jgi:hypothetical protein